MNPKDKIDSSWKSIVDIALKSEETEYINKVLPDIEYYPKSEDIFNVFSMPLSDIKVVILGQDPYPNIGQAIGYAFAVSEKTPYPASLRIIKQEVYSSSVNTYDSIKPIDEWKTLEHWREQGVFLLNTALTVEARKAGSHLKYWKEFTEIVIGSLAHKHKCVWLLWGKKAQEYERIVKLYPGNEIVKTPHPAAEAYSGGTAGFLGSDCFKNVNSILEKQGKRIINW